MPSNDNGRDSRFSARKNATSNRKSEVDVINIDTQRSIKAFDDIFKAAKKDAIEYNKFYVKTSADAVGSVAKMTVETYSKMYSQLSSMHTRYLNDMVARESRAVSQLNNIWGSRSGTRGTGDIVNNFSFDTTGILGEFSSALNGNVESFISSITEEIESDVENGVRDTNKEIKDGLKDMGKKLVSELVGYFSNFLGSFNSGVTKYFDAYERTFTSISTRMSTNYKDTRDYYSRSLDMISGDLKNIVNISDDLVPAMEKVAEQGLTGQTALNKAYGDAIVSVLMPWLDTTSDAFVNMSANLSTSQMNNMKGQQLLLQSTQSGNRLLQSGVINSLTNELAPLLTNIDFNTGGANNMSAEYQAIMQQLVDNGMSTTDAYAQVQNYIKNDKNLYDALSSGNISDVMYAAYRVGGDSIVDAASKLTNTVADIAGSTNTEVEAAAVLSVLGMIVPGGWSQNYRQTVIDSDAAKELASYLGNTGEQSRAYTAMVNSGRESLTATKSVSNWLENTGTQILGRLETLIPYGNELYSMISRNLGVIISQISLINASSFIRDSGSLLSGIGDSVGSKISSIFGPRYVGKYLAPASTASKIISGVGAGAGIALAGIGTVNAIDDIKTASSTSIDEQRRTSSVSAGMNIAGAAAGLTGAGMLLASNPVGWAVLAASGVAIAGAKIYKSFNQVSKVTEDVAGAYDAQLEAMRQEQAVRDTQIDNIRDQVLNTTDLEDKRSIAINNGILTQEEANSMTSAQLTTFFDKMDIINEEMDRYAENFLAEANRQTQQDQERIRSNDKQSIIDYATSLQNSGDKDTLGALLRQLGFDEKQINKVLSGKTSASSLLTSRVDNKLWGFIGGQSRLDSISGDDYNRVMTSFGIDGELLGQYDVELQSTIANYKAFLKSWRDRDRVSSIQSKYDEYKQFLMDNGESEFVINGRYKSGLPFVSNDSIVEVHRGEAILTADQNIDYITAKVAPILSNAIYDLIGNTRATNSEEIQTTVSASSDEIVKAIKEVAVDIVSAIKSVSSQSANANQASRTVSRPTPQYDESAIGLRSTLGTYRIGGTV